jgi:hypothetical protein
MVGGGEREVKGKACWVLVQGKVAGSNVGVELVFARPGFVERAEQPAMGFAKRRRFEAARGDRGIDPGIVGRVSAGNRQIAGVQLDVFVTGNSLDPEFARWHSNEKPRILGDVNSDLEIILGTARDAQFRFRRGRFEPDGEVPGIVSLSARKLNCNFVFVAPLNSEIAGPQIHAEFASGRERHREWVMLKIGKLDFRLGQGPGKTNYGQSDKE